MFILPYNTGQNRLNFRQCLYHTYPSQQGKNNRNKFPLLSLVLRNKVAKPNADKGTRTLTHYEPEPKSGVSANSTISAECG